MSKASVLVLLACVSVAAFVGWRVHAMSGATVNHFAILEDPSASYTGECEAAIGSAEEVLRSPAASPRSKLIFLALGDGLTANEPQEVGKYDLPISRKVIEGGKAKERHEAVLLEKISRACRSVRPTAISPIFLGVRQALADLKAAGCAKGSGCKLWVNSDLEENVEPSIRSRLSRAGGRGSLPAALDNEGIGVTFCGYASTAGRAVDPTGNGIRRFGARNPEREDRMQNIWRSLFVNAERVTFEPYCPKPGTSTLY
jgi:hypothetical protein